MFAKVAIPWVGHGWLAALIMPRSLARVLAATGQKDLRNISIPRSNVAPAIAPVFGCRRSLRIQLRKLARRFALIATREPKRVAKVLYILIRQTRVVPAIRRPATGWWRIPVWTIRK